MWGSGRSPDCLCSLKNATAFLFFLIYFFFITFLPCQESKTKKAPRGRRFRFLLPLTPTTKRPKIFHLWNLPFSVSLNCGGFFVVLFLKNNTEIKIFHLWNLPFLYRLFVIRFLYFAEYSSIKSFGWSQEGAFTKARLLSGFGAKP